jgi:hypothetical protein
MWIVIKIPRGTYTLDVAEQRLSFGVFQRGRELYWNLMRHDSLSVQADPNLVELRVNTYGVGRLLVYLSQIGEIYPTLVKSSFGKR